jgi:GDP-fucose transporter C1
MPHAMSDNVARCLSLVFNVIFTYVFLAKSTSYLTMSTLLVVLVGFVSGVEGELDFSLIGTTAGVAASMFVSLNSVMTSKMLSFVDNDKSLLLYSNNFNATFLFLPLIVLFEKDVLYANRAKLASGLFWVYMSITGVMGFAIGLVTVLQVKATSPLTHNISGIAKSAFQSVLAFYIWGNQATAKGLAGIGLVLLGTGLYTYVQMQAPARTDATKQ